MTHDPIMSSVDAAEHYAGAVVRARYDDNRHIQLLPEVNHEIAVHIGQHEPVIVNADELRDAANLVADMASTPPEATS